MSHKDINYGRQCRRYNSADEEVLIAFLMRNTTVIQCQNDGTVMWKGVEGDLCNVRDTGERIWVATHIEELLCEVLKYEVQTTGRTAGEAGDHGNDDEQHDVRATEGCLLKEVEKHVVTWNCTHDGSKSADGCRIYNGHRTVCTFCKCLDDLIETADPLPEEKA